MYSLLMLGELREARSARNANSHHRQQLRVNLPFAGATLLPHRQNPGQQKIAGFGGG
jgi:hypothetical protein